MVKLNNACISLTEGDFGDVLAHMFDVIYTIFKNFSFLQNWRPFWISEFFTA